ncbi:MAG TPA: hypothetical protein VHB50_00065, partial [Bryobacteraceae bacterium]|nr:hypothetical protein [Bryobacteraceae bacterium]
LTACLIVALIMPFDRWNRAALALGVGVLVFGGQWNHLWPPHHNSNWRQAASQLRAWEAGQSVPVIAPSPFIEARPPVWHPDLSPRGFLYSHLLVYDTPGRIYPFPFETSPEAERYARRLANGDLERAGRFAIYGGDRNVRFWRQWFAAQPELARWRNRKLGSFGDVEIAVFWRDAPATQPVMLGNNR